MSADTREQRPNHGLTRVEHFGLCLGLGATLLGLVAWMAVGFAVAAYLLVSISLMLGGA